MRIALRQPFADLAAGPLAMAGKQPSQLDDIVRQTVQEAWQDASLEKYKRIQPIKGAAEHCGVVMGSSRSYLQRWEAMTVQAARQSNSSRLASDIASWASAGSGAANR